MPPQRLKDKVQQFKGNDDPQNKSRIVVEGVDEPKRGRDYDRVKIDPFTRNWFYHHEIPGTRGPTSKT